MTDPVADQQVTESTASLKTTQSWPANLPNLVKVVQSMESDPNILPTLNTLRLEAKGNDRVKAYIGEQIGPQLVKLAAGEHLEIALGAAKLLRSITVYRKNKLVLKDEIPAILKLVQTTSSKQLQIPLAAIIWNLSSLRPNRDILMQEGVLTVLCSLLKVEGEVQNEAAGAARNLTLDERYLGNFADTEIIDILVDIIPKATAPTLMTCVLVALRNLSSHEKNQEKMGTLAGVRNMMSVIAKPSVNPSKDQKYVLETIALMSKNAKVLPVLAQSQISEFLVPLLTSPNDFLSAPCKEILNNLQNGNALGDQDDIRRQLNNKDMLGDNENYVRTLLEKLNLDDNIKAKDIILKK